MPIMICGRGAAAGCILMEQLCPMLDHLLPQVSGSAAVSVRQWLFFKNWFIRLLTKLGEIVHCNGHTHWNLVQMYCRPLYARRDKLKVRIAGRIAGHIIWQKVWTCAILRPPDVPAAFHPPLELQLTYFRCF